MNKSDENPRCAPAQFFSAGILLWNCCQILPRAARPAADVMVLWPLVRLKFYRPEFLALRPQLSGGARGPGASFASPTVGLVLLSPPVLR